MIVPVGSAIATVKTEIIQNSSLIVHVLKYVAYLASFYYHHFHLAGGLTTSLRLCILHSTSLVLLSTGLA